MSYEPDRLLAFHRSGYQNWQEWWHHQRDWGPFPVVMVAAALVGAVGGVLQRYKARTRTTAPDGLAG